MAPWSPVALPPRFVAARRTRLVGRRYELGVLESVWERVAQGAGQVLLVGGEPGAGKTRLAAEVAGVAARAGRRGAGGHGDQGRRGRLPAVRRDAGPPVPTSEAGTLEAARRAAAAVPARRPPPPGRRRAGRRRPPRPVRGGGGAVPLDRPGPAAGRRPRRPALGTATDRRTARARRPLLPGHPRARARHLPDHRAGPVGRAQRPARRPAPARRRAPPRPGRARHRRDRRVRERHAGVSPAAARAPAAILRDRTGGNPFFLRELWLDLERRGGVAALRGRATGAGHARRHGGAPGWPGSASRCGRPSTWPR